MIVWVLKFIRNTIFAIIAIALLLCVIVAIVFNFVLTPERMTPVIERMASEYINSEITIGAVDFSLFSTLPKVTVRVDSLRIKQLAEGEDDLFSVDQCVVTITPRQILNKRIVVNEILFKRPSINLYVDSLVRPMAHFKLDSLEVKENDTDTAAQFNLGEYLFRLDSIRIDSSRIVIDDRTKKFYSAMDNMSLGMKIFMSEKGMYAKSDFGFESLNIKLDGKTFSSNTEVHIESKLLYRQDSTLLRISDTQFNVNGIDMTVEGTLQGDKVNRCAYVDINSTLKTPSLVEFLNLIPTYYFSHKDSITTQGVVNLGLKVNGVYSKTQSPDFRAHINVDNAKLRYGSNPISLDRIDCDADMLIDLNTPTNSYAKLNRLHVNTSGIIDLNVKGNITNIMESPYIDVDLDSDIDFNRIYEIVPLQAGVTLTGRNINDLHTRFALEDLENKNFGKVYIDGVSKFDKVKIDIDGKKFSGDSTATSYFAVDIDKGDLLFGDRVKKDNSRTLLATIGCSGFGFKDRDGVYTSIKDMKLTMGANFDRATQKVNGVGMNAVMNSSKLGVENVVDVELESTDMTLTISPKNEERDMKILAKISSESITATEGNYNSNISTKRANMELNMQREAKRKWYLKGWSGFRDFNFYSDLFPIDISLDRSRITIDGNRIRLQRAKMGIGRSKMVATGYITNVLGSIFVDPHLPIKGKLNIKSPILDVNELIDATNKSMLLNTSDSTTVAAIPSDTASMMLLVPKGVTFDFNLDVDKIIYSKASIDNMLGEASIKDGVLTLDKLSFATIGADTFSSIKYKNIDENSSNLAMDINLKGAEISRIDELLPTVAEMIPMMNGVKGIVDFQLRANTNIDRNLNVDFETLRAATSLKGKDLILLDDETFEDIAKTLMFKRRAENLIDTVSVFVLADKSRFTVQPFEFTMDRYKMIIGGEQTVNPKTYDLDYQYNVSIIKSPLPFKAGVDINGRNEDFKYKITKAKLKNSDFAALKEEYDKHLESIEQ